jgi:glycosyltransferase involved in cell wall biosynthesis
MKILYSCLSKSWGGMEMFTLTAIKQLMDRGIGADLLCTAESRIHIEATNMGLIIHPIKSKGYFNLFAALKISLLIRKGDYSLVHTQASKDLWLLVPALKLANCKIPLFLTKQLGSFIVKKDLLHKWLYKRLTKAFAISNVIKNNLLETCPLPADKILLLHNGVDTEKFNPDSIPARKVRTEFNIGESDIVIGLLARFTPGKGHEEFLWAANQLNKDHGNLKYLVVGEASRGEDEYAKNIKKLAKEYDLKNLIFTGFRSDTPEVLAAMDIFIFPSHSEAFGIALVEAMAMAKPSVCSNADGVKDIAVKDETSYLFENKNSEDLYQKIQLLVDSPETRIKFGSAARKRVVNNFDINIVTERVIKYYSIELTGK